MSCVDFDVCKIDFCFVCDMLVKVLCLLFVLVVGVDCNGNGNGLCVCVLLLVEEIVLCCKKVVSVLSVVV